MKNVNRGFSLIEVAIAVLVIGLVATFSLKGKELIQTARLRSTIDQVESIRIAVNTFVDKYGALPGDLKNAKELIDNSLENGNGDGNFETIADSQRFWSHLSKSGLISFEQINGCPASKLGGYFTVSSKLNGKPGVWLVLSKGTSDNRRFSGILTPENARYIDRAIDTGLPESGDVQVMKGEGASGECVENSNYNLRNKNADCVVIFKIW